ncbi:CGLAU_01105 family protein [Corynebacterium pacaense]|uniref:CGLAU_01105 family protein n=1 Tax=Corynebacterium pacaense TaxID=1816684 RepID=UPI0009BA9F58|nr:CGLAU_01105 family protein [Corynebacterium pacaense]
MSGEEDRDGVLNKWGQAGSAAGDLAGKVTRKVREDLGDDSGEGIGKLKADASGALDSIRKADSREDYLQAGREIARDAGGFIKGVAESVKSVVAEEGDATRAAFASAVESSRDRFDDAVDSVRSKRGARKAEKEEGTQPNSPDATKDAEEDIIDGEVVAEQGDTGTPTP